MIDNLFPCDISAFVTIQGAIMRLRTIGLISTLVLGLLSGPLPAEAQQVGKVYRIGFLASGRGGRVETLKEVLHELGYVDGKRWCSRAVCTINRFDALTALRS